MFQKKWSRDEAVEIPPARKPRYFEYSETCIKRTLSGNAVVSA